MFLITCMQNFKVNVQSFLKVEWKQMDGQTDGGECNNSDANADEKEKHTMLPINT